jgi:hypothetical protein
MWRPMCNMGAPILCHHSMLRCRCLKYGSPAAKAPPLNHTLSQSQHPLGTPQGPLQQWPLPSRSHSPTKGLSGEQQPQQSHRTTPCSTQHPDQCTPQFCTSSPCQRLICGDVCFRSGCKAPIRHVLSDTLQCHSICNHCPKAAPSPITCAKKLRM